MTVFTYIRLCFFLACNIHPVVLTFGYELVAKLRYSTISSRTLRDKIQKWRQLLKPSRRLLVERRCFGSSQSECPRRLYCCRTRPWARCGNACFSRASARNTQFAQTAQTGAQRRWSSELMSLDGWMAGRWTLKTMAYLLDAWVLRTLAASVKAVEFEGVLT